MFSAGHSRPSVVMVQALEAEEDRLWQEQMQAAGEAAEAARGNYVAAQEVGALSSLFLLVCLEGRCMSSKPHFHVHDYLRAWW